MQRQLKKTKQKGFTLIELMVTIAIVGILAAIAVPAYQYYINKARYSELVIAGTEMKVRVSEAISTSTGTASTLNIEPVGGDGPDNKLSDGVQKVVVTKRAAANAVAEVKDANGTVTTPATDPVSEAYVITVTPTGKYTEIPQTDVLKFIGTSDKDNSRVNWTLCGVGKGAEYVSEATTCAQ
jgi:type IV pilus assembly protein PilA